MRKVNKQGWLIDDDDNIIDNLGRVKILKQQLKDKNKDIPPLFNYEGKQYKIKDIIGIFDRDPDSKEIIMNQNENETEHYRKFWTYDKTGRRVNPKGYLLDNKGNIIDKDSDPERGNCNIIWSSHELLYNEPPKIFTFTEFSEYWIKGNLDRNFKMDPKNDNAVDLDGLRVNELGYLIDHNENIVDSKSGTVVFRREILSKAETQDAEIPKVFKSGNLLAIDPDDDEIEEELRNRNQRYKYFGNNMRDQDEKSQTSLLNDSEILSNFMRQDNQNLFSDAKNMKMPPYRDALGREIKYEIQMEDDVLKMNKEVLGPLRRPLN